MVAGNWTLDDIPWDRFDPALVDPDLLRIAKAASMVEHNAGDYVAYLCNVFSDDTAFQRTARVWGDEEVQHGQALGRWAELADPSFDFASSFKRFQEGYHIPVDSAESVRGSRVGELIARCVVETGTSSFYSALADAAEEPVFKDICRRIAADEFRHYKLFYDQANIYAEHERLSPARRLLISVSRVMETEDDELAYAYYAAHGGDEPYDRKVNNREYMARAYQVYRRQHIERGISMIMKAVGLNPRGWLSRLLSGGFWRFVRFRASRARPWLAAA